MQPEVVSPAPTQAPEVPASSVTAPASTLPPVPEKWPGAFGLFKYSKAAVGHNVWTIITLIVLVFAVNIVLGAIFPGHETTQVINGTSFTTREDSLVASLLSNLVGVAISIAMYVTLLAGIRREKVSVGQAFMRVKLMLYLKYIGVSILAGILVVASLLALVIPFFFVAPRLALIYYFLIDKDMGVTDSIKASWDSTKGNVGKVYGIFGATLLFALLIITIIGIPVAIFLLVAYSAAYALLYRYITDNRPTAEAVQA